MVSLNNSTTLFFKQLKLLTNILIMKNWSYYLENADYYSN